MLALTWLKKGNCSVLHSVFSYIFFWYFRHNQVAKETELPFLAFTFFCLKWIREKTKSTQLRSNKAEMSTISSTVRYQIYDKD